MRIRFATTSLAVRRRSHRSQLDRRQMRRRRRILPSGMTALPTLPTMLILRGIATHDRPHGALDEPAALEYAKQSGYVGKVLDVSGEAGPNSPQTHAALHEIRNDPSIVALYGFSGGGYNVKHILKQLTLAEKARIKQVVVLGAPKNPSSVYQGPWELVYRTNPVHMDGPRALLGELVSKNSAASV